MNLNLWFPAIVIKQARSFITTYFSSAVNKRHLDFTNVPKIREEDLKERFVRGSGPGGQSVSKTSNCVVLQHVPTGLVVKCHHTRSVFENRKIARILLVNKLDNLINKDMSVEAQTKKILEERTEKRDSKRRKLEQLKQKWKERENKT